MSYAQTIELTVEGFAQQVITYYNISDMSDLCTPSSIPDFLSQPYAVSAPAVTLGGILLTSFVEAGETKTKTDHSPHA